jgi:hypothetical protein
MAKLPTDIKALARVHTETALHTLAKIMTTSDAPAAARVAAAQALLSRGWGQPEQAVEVKGEITSKVIRTPAVASTNAAWLEQHGDKPDTLQ